jgi:hypothetical protein
MSYHTDVLNAYNSALEQVQNVPAGAPPVGCNHDAAGRLY